MTDRPTVLVTGGAGYIGSHICVSALRAGHEVAILDMTLTSAACPLTDVIEDQSRNALVRSGLVDDLKINWVWMPPWGPDKITEDGREQLRALGFTV